MGLEKDGGYLYALWRIQRSTMFALLLPARHVRHRYPVCRALARHDIPDIS
jgi:hypothetical protein